MAHLPYKSKYGGTVGECHKCKFNKIVENMANESPERIEQARTACMNCRGASDESCKGLSIVHLGGVEGVGEYLVCNISRDYLAMMRTERKDIETLADAKTNAEFLELLREFVGMDEINYLCVLAFFKFRLYCGGDLVGVNLGAVMELGGFTREQIEQAAGGFVDRVRRAGLAAGFGFMGFVDCLCKMPVSGMIAMRHILRGAETVTEAAELAGVSKQAMSKTIARAAREYPPLLAFLPNQGLRRLKTADDCRESVEHSNMINNERNKMIKAVRKHIHGGASVGV